MNKSPSWYLAGLGLTTLATLALETLDTRLLSVLTWYHLSFLAISMAMFGMSAGAVHVYLAPQRFGGDAAKGALPRMAFWFAAAIPLAHIVNLAVPLSTDRSLTNAAAYLLSTVTLAVPFYFSGIAVAIALTRIPGKIGVAYAVDLVGASLGALAVVPLLTLLDLSSGVFIVAGVGALGAACFAVYAGQKPGRSLVLALGLVVFGFVNHSTIHGFRVAYAKGRELPTDEILHEEWTVHGQAIAKIPTETKPFYWGAGEGVPDLALTTAQMRIDGEAGTTMTKWDGDVASLSWARFDVTSLPHHLRPGQDVAVIGVGGGRDILTALWGRARSVTGIEINRAFIRLLTGSMAKFAGLAGRSDVTLVHDEARSYLTRTDKRFGVLQMSLIDTWAATGAGAFTLTENALYTVDGWHVFLGALQPGGIFSVSRWFSPEKASETSRLLALATQVLLERGATDPSTHMALVTRKNIATLIVSTEPLTAADLAGIENACATYGFTWLMGPGHPPSDPVLVRIQQSRSKEALLAAVADPYFDYTPPTDERPFFFNMFKPAGLFTGVLKSGNQGVMTFGNLLATGTLLMLEAIAAFLVGAIILVPLWRSGLPKMERKPFVMSVAWFAMIGMAFMMVQIPFMQRFSVFLGHPTYAVVVILFSMILFTGLGAFASEKLPLEAARWPSLVLPLLLGALLVAETLAIPTIVHAATPLGLVPRALCVVAVAAPVSFLAGFFFPMGMRLVGRLSPDAAPWMWGINGASGVLASATGVAVSMWAGIPASLLVAAVLYAALVLPGAVLWAAGQAAAGSARAA